MHPGPRRREVLWLVRPWVPTRSALGPSPVGLLWTPRTGPMPSPWPQEQEVGIHDIGARQPCVEQVGPALEAVEEGMRVVAS